MKFRVKAEITDRQTGHKGTFDGTVSDVDSKDAAWHATHETLTRNGIGVGRIDVDEER